MKSKKMTKVDYLLAFLFGVIVIIQGGQVFFRYIINSSLVWAEELSRFIFAWIIMIGAIVAIKENKHIHVDLVIRKLPVKVRGHLKLFSLCIITVFSAFITVIGFQLVEITKDTISPAMALPLNYVFYAALPVASIFGIYVSIHGIISHFKTIHAEKEEEA